MYSKYEKTINGKFKTYIIFTLISKTTYHWQYNRQLHPPDGFLLLELLAIKGDSSCAVLFITVECR